MHNSAVVLVMFLTKRHLLRFKDKRFKLTFVLRQPVNNLGNSLPMTTTETHTSVQFRLIGLLLSQGIWRQGEQGAQPVTEFGAMGPVVHGCQQQ